MIRAVLAWLLCAAAASAQEAPPQLPLTGDSTGIPAPGIIRERGT